MIFIWKKKPKNLSSKLTLKAINYPLKKEEPNINSLPIPKIKIEGEFEGEKKEIKKMTYKEPIGSLKEYKDGTYQLTEKGWKKIIPKTISL